MHYYDMKRTGIGALLLCILIGCVFLAACTSSEPSESIPQETIPETTVPEETVMETPEPTPEPTEEVTIFDQPVTQPPEDLSVAVTAQKDPVYATITVAFDGGLGQDLIQSIEVRADLSDGQVVLEPLGTNKGDSIEIDGTRGTDRVQVAVTFMNGQSYKILDQELSLVRLGDETPTPTVEGPVIPEDEGIYAGPVEEPPQNLAVSVSVDKDPIYRVITATFRGGHGQALVSNILVHAILSTGEEVTKNLASDMGAIAEIQGTAGVDKVQVLVSYKNGETYKIFEETFGPRG